MKKILSLLVLFPILAFSQSTDQNYTKTTTYKNPNATTLTSPTIDDADVQVTYFDGLGRPIQKIASQQSATGKDIVIPIEYDAFGRQVKEYLPYTNQSPSLNYNPNALTEILSYPKYTGQNPYSEKLFEASPLNRVLKQGAPGDDWALGSGHEIKLDYQANATNEVKQYKATATWNATSGMYDISLVNAAGTVYYDANQLYKNIIKNENWTTGNNNTTEEFKDKEGRVVLKRTYNNNVPHETYYVYDQFSKLTYVIPPLVSGTITATILDNLCYQYKYDYRSRVVAKKIPAKQWDFIAYDKLDRPVATGPVFNPFGGTDVGWIITKYDVFNRVVYTAWMGAPTIGTAELKTFQDLLNNNTVLNETRQLGKILGGIPIDYTNLVNIPSNLLPLTINYYDNYVFPDVASIPPDVEGQTVLVNVKNLPTGTWVRALTGSSATLGETTTTFYDTKSRRIRTYSKNYLDGYIQTDSNLDFTGKTLQTIITHKRAGADPEIKITEKFSYSPQGRLLTHTHKIGASGVVELLASNTYDELGQLISKNVGGTSGLQKVDYNYNIRGWLTGINNTDDLQNESDPKDLFAFKLNYNNPVTGTPLYNGNISETFWRSNSDNILRKYKYRYDNLNRLLEANYSKPGVSNFDSYKEKLSYDMNGNIMTLQRNGNMDTNGQTTVNLIDNLNYTYQSNSNQLQKVVDATNSSQGFKDDLLHNAFSDDYTYDANGNMNKDLNKGITAITYNHLNLPTKISFGLINKIEYIYNAVGQKLQKKVTENSGLKITTTQYVNGFQYTNNVLSFFPHAEGYVNNTVVSSVNKYNYVYNYTDHLGNIRLSYGLDPVNDQGIKIMEENHYYAFGLKHTNYNSDQLVYQKGITVSVVLKTASSINPVNYKYKYNGKEYQDELGLNLTDMDFRQYDNAIGRFNVMDALAEEDFVTSPYAFVGNNPVLYGDPSGLKMQAPLETGGGGGIVPGSILSMVASGMSGSDITAALQAEMWGPSGGGGSGGGGGGGGSGSGGTMGLVNSLVNISNNSDFDSVSWDSSTGDIVGQYTNDKVPTNSEIYDILQRGGIANPNQEGIARTMPNITKILDLKEIQAIIKGKDKYLVDYGKRIAIQPGDGDHYGNTYPKTGNIEIYSTAFNTWARLALTLIHECGHRQDLKFGRWVPNSRGETATYATEYRMWTRSGTLGDQIARQQIIRNEYRPF